MKFIFSFLVLLYSLAINGQNDLAILIDTLNKKEVYIEPDSNSNIISLLLPYELIEVDTFDNNYLLIKRNDIKGYVATKGLFIYDDLPSDKKKFIIEKSYLDFVKLIENGSTVNPKNKTTNPLLIENDINLFIISRLNPILPSIKDLVCNYNDNVQFFYFVHYVVNLSDQYSNDEILKSFTEIYFCQTELVTYMIDNVGWPMDQIYIRYLKLGMDIIATNNLNKYNLKKKKKEFNNWINSRKAAEAPIITPDMIPTN